MKSKTTLRILREQDLRKILSVNKGLEIIEKTFRDYGSSMTQRLSDPTSLFSGSGQEGDAKFKVKGATLMTEGVTGIRLVSDLPGEQGVRAYHLLCVCDDRTGAPIGLIDETWLHRFRTALTGVVAAKFLARPEAKTVALLGAGAIAKELFPALTNSFRLKEIRVVTRHEESSKKFCKLFDEHFEPDFIPFKFPKNALDGADIVISLTFAEKALILPGMLSPGVFVCSMGETEEVSFGVLDEIDVFVVDELNYATVLGDISVWLKKQLATREEIEQRIDANIGEVIAKKRGLRKSNDQRILAIIQGMAICDLALANYALRSSFAMDLGQDLNVFDWL